ncbi:hypothetical protein Ae201684_005887 [Aphanomyces euteiches]|uniref:Uncharacterized protein n=1 Tax=Aphanomyces euteiches TaxID=100861 RepID=A0A6G0XCG4_9STRA|nr:hypothetical protein Ae201684_005887 [Aphanomyces euteiches]
MVYDDTDNLFTLCKAKLNKLRLQRGWKMYRQKMLSLDLFVVERFKANGVCKRIEQADWIRHRDVVRAKILTLPPVGPIKKRTRRVVTGARLLSISELSVVDTTKSDRQNAKRLSEEQKAKRANKRNKPSKRNQLEDQNVREASLDTAYEII